jgi:hypothetical protein
MLLPAAKTLEQEAQYGRSYSESDDENHGHHRVSKDMPK